MTANNSLKTKNIFGFELGTNEVNNNDQDSKNPDKDQDSKNPDLDVAKDKNLKKIFPNSVKEKFEELKQRRKIQQTIAEKNLAKKTFRKRKKKRNHPSVLQAELFSTLQNKTCTVVKDESIIGPKYQKTQQEQIEEKSGATKLVKKIHWGFDAKERWEMKGNL